MAAKWLELLKEIASNLTRAAVLRDPAVASGLGLFGTAQAVAPSLRVELTPVESAMQVKSSAAFPTSRVLEWWPGCDGECGSARSSQPYHRPDGTVSITNDLSRPRVRRRRGLVSYRPDQIDPYRRAAEYVDPILKGERPGDLPVQAHQIRVGS